MTINMLIGIILFDVFRITHQPQIVNIQVKV